jgi:hypothetical protein
MPYKGERPFPLMFTAASQLERNRFLTLTKSTGIVAYSTYGDDVELVSRARGDANNYQIACMPLAGAQSSFFITLNGTVAKGDPLFASTSGKAVTSTYTATNRSLKTEPTENNACYIVPHTGWAAGAHPDAIATSSGAGVFTYIDVAAIPVGTVAFLTSEGQYVQFNGTLWVDVQPLAYANEAGVATQDIVAYVTRAIGTRRRQDLPDQLNNEMRIVCAGASTSETDGDATITVTDGRILATDIAICCPQAGTTAANLQINKAVCTADTLTITLAGNGGAGTIINYIVLRAIVNN